MQDYCRHRLHYRKNQPNPFYVMVPCICKLRLMPVLLSMIALVLQNQRKLHIESLQGIVDVIDKGCIDGAEIGKKTMSPASHIGGRRYMIQSYHDGIAICKVHGPLISLLHSLVIQSG